MAWQCLEHPGSLPNDGGLRNQPVGLMVKMRACLNAYEAVKGFVDSGLSIKWIEKNRDKYELFVRIQRMRDEQSEEQEG